MNIKLLFKFYVLKNIKFITMTLAVLIIPFIFVEHYSIVMHKQATDILNGLIYIVLYFLAPTLSIGIAIFNLIRCFKGTRGIRQKLFNIALTYLILIISFANLYYMETCIGDFSDAVSKYFKYHNLNYPFSKVEKEKFISSNYKFDDERAFKGMHYRLWSGVDYETFDYKEPEEVEFTEDIIKNANFENKEFENNIKFIPENRKRAYLECLYFSTISLATVGFGDISPDLWYSKLTVMGEVVMGQILIVIAVGFFFSNNSSNDKSDSKNYKMKDLSHINWRRVRRVKERRNWSNKRRVPSTSRRNCCGYLKNGRKLKGGSGAGLVACCYAWAY